SNEMFAAFATTCATLAGLVSVKSAVEHLANGGGVKGALRSLLTENTPPPPSPESRP
ncbi:MAG: hypothetical protein HY901_15550, partial [Deltaproteobacteria bacterium]|nr:hypothetical protein [Deltaproteobacteria bacterium]